MSRIGKQPVPFPSTVDVTIEPEVVRVNGPRGALEERVSRDLTIEKNDGEIVVKRPTDRGEHRALHGLTRSLIANMVTGVTEGFEKRFEVPVPTQIIVRGNAKQVVGEIAAQIRKVRPPEPYKGKGIRYADEHVARKVGKRA